MRQLVKLVGASLCVCFFASVSSGCDQLSSGEDSGSPTAPSTSDDPSLRRAVFDVSVTPAEDNLELKEAGVWLDGSEVFRTACSSCTDQSTALRLINENAPTILNSGEHTFGVKITDFAATGATACVICSYEFSHVRVTILDSSGTTVQTINLPNRERAPDPDASTDWSFTVN